MVRQSLPHPSTALHHRSSSRPRHVKEKSLHKRSNSLVFRFEEEVVDNVCPPRVAVKLPADFQSALARMQRDLSEVWRHAEAAREKALDASSGEVDLAKFAAALLRRGHQVWLRCGAQRVQSLGRSMYTFCVIEQPGGQLLIADPYFREQFAVAAAPDSYINLLQLLPPVFVGTAEHLNTYVSLLCSEVAKVFEHKGLACPPWRTKKAMLFKWLPTITNDVPVV